MAALLDVLDAVVSCRRMLIFVTIAARKRM